MSDDEKLQAMGAEFMKALHARIEAMDAGSVKAFMHAQATVAHIALGAIQDKALDQGMVSSVTVVPYSGGVK